MAKSCTNCKYKLAALFVPPTLEELRAFADQIGWETFNAEDFFDKHAKYGWLDKDGRMIKDWKAEIRIWMRAALRRGDTVVRTDKKTFRERLNDV